MDHGSHTYTPRLERIAAGTLAKALGEGAAGRLRCRAAGLGLPGFGQWQARLDEALHATGGAFLVAHSLGCLLAASYAGRAQSHLIRGALLVAPCSLEATTELHPCMIDFGEEPLERLPFPSLVVGSLNDPYMGVEQLERHVKAWGSGLAMIGFAGHINVASGFGRWPEGYELFETLRRQEAVSPSRSPALVGKGACHAPASRP